MDASDTLTPVDEKLWLRNQPWADVKPAGRPFDTDAAYDVGWWPGW